MSKFSEAFRAARAAGKKNFTWNGNSYNTKLKEAGSGTKKPAAKEDKWWESDNPKPAAKAEAKPAAKAAEKPAPKAAAKPYYEDDDYDKTQDAFKKLPPPGNKVMMKKGGAVAMKKPLPAFMMAKMADKKMGKKKPMKKMASGGSVSSRADGIAQRGKTKTKMV